MLSKYNAVSTTPRSPIAPIEIAGLEKTVESPLPMCCVMDAFFAMVSPVG